jgi:hypothetical protein
MIFPPTSQFYDGDAVRWPSRIRRWMIPNNPRSVWLPFITVTDTKEKFSASYFYNRIPSPRKSVWSVQKSYCCAILTLIKSKSIKVIARGASSKNSNQKTKEDQLAATYSTK